jgi:FkbM family methyltransferase
MDFSKLSNPEELGGCVYYSQNREDLVLLSFFPDVMKGFYVDVGAFDPDYDSVTKLFYLQGWSGINIEPQLNRWKLFQKKRKRDININAGIAEKEGKLILRAYKSEGLATFSNIIKDEYEQTPSGDNQVYTETTVPVAPLRKVLNAYHVEHIDFMKIDVEGLEYEVLASNDWEMYRPEVICIEANHIQKDWHPILRKAGYDLVFDDGLNEYFTDNRTDRKQKFDYVKDVVHDRGGGVRADHFQLMLDWRTLAISKSHHVEKLAGEKRRLERNLNNAKDQIQAYEVERNSIKATVKRLLHLLGRNLREY